MLGLVFVDIVNMLATGVSVRYMDSLPRRWWLLIGSSGMMLSLLLLSLMFLNRDSMGSQSSSAVGVGSLMLYVLFFGMSWGPLGWLICSELFPTRVRALATAVTTFANWSFNFAVSFSFLHVVHALKVSTGECSSNEDGGGASGQCSSGNASSGNASSASGTPSTCACTTHGEGYTFLLYAGFCAISLAFVVWGLPETRGLTLEQIQQLFAASGRGARQVSDEDEDDDDDRQSDIAREVDNVQLLAR
jgi:hypothetical protein